jgi:hypothetical protein
MRVNGQTTFETVLGELHRARDPRQGSGPWTERLMALTEAQFGSEWWEVVLSGDEAAAIVLPWHAGEPCHGDRLTLIERRGSSVSAAATRLAAMKADYARENPSCWGRISKARREPFSRVILARAPLDHEEYRGIDVGSALYCVDGRHRLLGWALEGRLTSTVSIRAHVAGSAE